MCGIAGYVISGDLPGAAMIEVLNHRGPDMVGEYDARVCGRHVFLGHARLSIIDLSDAGAQPMTAEHRRVTIAFNGEVYNFQELRARFLSGYGFRSRTDTEVLLYLYCELGPAFVQHLNGDFAIAILDEDRNRLFLYRDRLGIKPFYVYDSGGTFAFASEIKSFSAAALPVTLSDTSLQQYLVFKYVPGNDTMFREVRRVPPASYLELDLASGQRELHRYWEPKGDPSLANADYGELQERLRELLRDAVRCRLVADVPIGTFFSGGIDSSVIAYFLRDHPEITHYCARKSEIDLKREGTTSDYRHARRIADDWGLNVVPIDIGSDEASLELLRTVLHYSDDLIADGSQILSYLITRVASERCSVMLSGMGGDELFLGYGGHLLILLSRYMDRLPAPVARAMAGRLADLDQGRGAFKAYRRWLHKLGKYYRYPSSVRYGLFSIVGDYESAASISRLDPEPVLAFVGDYFAGVEDPFEAVTRFEIDNFLVKNLHYFDRMCMANSVEGRVPYMDHRVVEFALSLPHDRKLSPLGKSKRILKDAFRDRLPDHVLRRRKAGFGMPLRSILSDPRKVRELLDLDFLASFPSLDVDRVPTLIERHTSGVEDQSQLIFALVSFQEWYRLHHASEVTV
jgi:asparagine synthase (glutamine-hydrolysing)